MLYLHGAGGIGKTMLLQRFAAEARAAGQVVVEVDARNLEPDPAAFEAEAVLNTDRAVLLVDTFERCQGLSGWLRDRFLPQLPVGSLVVIAGREAPAPRWTSDPGWSEVTHVVALPDLTREEAMALLAGRGVPASLHGRLLEFAGGNPLALTLAAAVAVRDGRAPEGWDPEGWEPSQDVVQALLPQLVGEVPTPTHRTALEVCAHVQVTTEALLRVVLGDEAGQMFAWLREQPFVESGRHGLFPTTSCGRRWRRTCAGATRRAISACTRRSMRACSPPCARRPNRTCCGLRARSTTCTAPAGSSSPPHRRGGRGAGDALRGAGPGRRGGAGLGRRGRGDGADRRVLDESQPGGLPRLPRYPHR